MDSTKLSKIEEENAEIKIVLHRAMEALHALNNRLVELEKKVYEEKAAEQQPPKLIY